MLDYFKSYWKGAAVSVIAVAISFLLYTFWDDIDALASQLPSWGAQVGYSIAGLVAVSLIATTIKPGCLGAYWSRRDVVRIVIMVGFFYLAAAMANPFVGGTAIAFALLTLLTLFSIPLIPGLVQALSNDPNLHRPTVEVDESGLDEETVLQQRHNVPDYEPFTFAFFTSLYPGQVKYIVRDERFRRSIMRYDGWSFKGDQVRRQRERMIGTSEEHKAPALIPINSRDYWEVVQTDHGEEDSHPIPTTLRKGQLDLIWLWSRWVYDRTGLIFTGIPPWQTSLVYEIEQLKKFILRDGTIVFVRKKNYSDHVRAAEFQFFVQLPSAETADQVRIRIQLALTMFVENSYRVMYDADKNWPSRLFTAVAEEASTHVRGYPYKSILAENRGDKDAVKEQMKRRIPTAVLRLNNKTRGGGRSSLHSVREIGLRIKEVEVINLETADAKLADALAEVARSYADAEARKTRADAEAYAVDRVASAARRNGDAGMRALERESDIRTAEAAAKGGANTIVNLGGERQSVDPKTAFLRQSILEGGK